jgi:hypothetical protein
MLSRLTTQCMLGTKCKRNGDRWFEKEMEMIDEEV